MTKAFTPLEKVQLLKLHLVEHIPVSEICDKNEVAPRVFNQWLELFFRDGAAVFKNAGLRGPGRPLKHGSEARVRELERKITHKDEVLAELRAEHIALKKKLGLG